MVVCELDSDISGEILGWKLPAWQALLFHRVLPSCGGLVVYLVVMCFDFALVFEHYQTGDEGVAVFSIILMILPALLSMVFTLASPPSSLQTEDSEVSVQIQKTDCYWILMQIINFLFFPVAAIGRYCHQIFWWIEAVCASRDGDDERTRDALHRVRAPSPLELYLFLQAFIHAAPHAVINIIEMMNKTSDPAFNKISVQTISVIASTLRMASTATMYRRFEREKICGRKYPWNLNSAEIDNITNEKIQNEIQNIEENIYETVQPRARRHSLSPVPQFSRKLNSDLIQFSPDVRNEMFFSSSGSESGSDYMVPVAQIDNHSQKPSDIESGDEYTRPKSLIDKIAPRRSTQYKIEHVEVLPPPRMPAPRMSLAVWADKMVENAESLPSWLSAPPRYRHYDEIVQDEPDLPRRAPRRFMRGLEPQDATAALVNFLGWHMFFMARLLSVAAFINFYPIVAIIILFSHYQIMLLLLIVPQASTVRRCFYIFLAFIYLFCLMEFKIRFRHVRAWHVFWLLVMTLETVVFTAVWATVNNELTSWWRQYVVVVIFGSTLLSYMCMLVFFVLLKPKETIVYLDEAKNT